MAPASRGLTIVLVVLSQGTTAMDGFVVDAAGVASCLASARSVASSCGCAGGGAARWVDDARCACDADAAAESCDAVLARAPGRGVLALNDDNWLQAASCGRDDVREIWGGNTMSNRHRHAW